MLTYTEPTYHNSNSYVIYNIIQKKIGYELTCQSNFNFVIPTKTQYQIRKQLKLSQASFKLSLLKVPYQFHDCRLTGSKILFYLYNKLSRLARFHKNKSTLQVQITRQTEGKQSDRIKAPFLH